MTSRLARLLSLPALSLPLVGAATGCVVVDSPNPPPPYNPYGDIAFDWSFDGIASCDGAGVDEVDIVVFQQGVVVDEINNEPCVGGGLILTEYFEGLYEVEIDAYARNDALLFSGGFTTRVNGGETTDVGLITLERFGDEPVPPTGAGDVGLFWSFAYPADEAIIACDIAGVREIDVELLGPGGPISETFDCAEDDGAFFVGLEAGRWTMNLDAYGTWHNDDLHLYEETVEFTVQANRELDLGDVVLLRDENSFADFVVRWGFNGASCSSEGITDVEISVHRNGLDEPEEISVVDCLDLEKHLSTFVPGTYTVAIYAEGSRNDWVSALTVDLAPDTTADVALQLAPAP